MLYPEPERPVARAVLGDDDVVANGVAYETNDRRQLQLLHDVMSVGLCRLDADVECGRNVLVTLAFGEELNDFTLTWRQWTT